MIKAVLDTNVLISAAISPNGTPAKLIAAWGEGMFELVVSPKLIAELDGVLKRTKLKERVTTDQRLALLASLRRNAELVADPEELPHSKSTDADDDYLIALAMASQSALVSGDRHLTDLRGTIPVFSPAEFLDYLPAA